MGGTIGRLNVLLDLMSDGFTKGLDSAQRKLDSFGRKLTTLGRDLTTKMTLPLAAAAAFSVKAASDLNESLNKSGVVFVDWAEDVVHWSENSATALGLSQQAALESAATFGNLFSSIGLGQKATAEMSMALVQLAVDQASFNNLPTSDVLQKINAGLVGEYEGLRSLGIILNETTVKQRALADNIGLTEKELTPAMLAQARYELILEQSTNAMGDFAETSGSFANQMKIVRARLTDTAASLGKILLPLVLKGLGSFNELITRFQELSPTTQKFILIAAGLLAVLGPLLIILGQVAIAVAALAPAFALLLGPIGLVIAALVALGIAYRTNLFGFRDAVNAVAGPIIDFAQQLIEAFGVNGISGALAILAIKLDQVFGGAATGVIIRFLEGVIELVGQFIDIIRTAVQLVSALISGDWARAWELFQQLVGQAVRFSIDQLLLFPGLLLDIFRSIDWGAVVSGIGDLGRRAFDWIKATFDAIDWGDLIANAGDALSAKGGELIRGLKSGIDTYWPVVAFWLANLGLAIAAAVPDLVSALLQKGADLVVGLKNGIDANWPLVAFFLANLGIAAAAAVGSLLTALVQKGIELLTGLLSGAVVFWNATVLPFLAGIPSRVVAAVGDLTSTLLQKGTDLMQGMRNGWAAAWPLFVFTLNNLGNSATVAVGSLIGTLNQKGQDLVQGLRNGWDTGWTLFSFTLRNVGNTASSAVGSLLGTLNQKGRDLMQGLRSGAEAGWSSVASFLGGIGPRAAGAVGNLGGYLYGAGVSLMAGLRSGIEAAGASALQAAQDWASRIASAVAGFFRIQSPSRLFAQYGVWLMEGLALGIDRGAPLALASVEDAARGIASASFGVGVPGLAGVGGGSVFGSTDGQRPIVQVFALKADEYERLLRDAQEGGAFARDFARVLGLKEGV